MPLSEQPVAPVSATPDEVLAAEIVNALIDANLMDKAKAGETRRRIAAGSMDQDDWRALVELKRPDKEGKANG